MFDLLFQSDTIFHYRMSAGSKTRTKGKLVTVTPLARGVFKDSLSYWSGKDIVPGALVSVTVQNRRLSALVVSVESLGDAKMQVRNSPFMLKKIESVKPNFLSPEFLAAASRTAKYFAAPIGGVLQTLIPKAILDSPGKPATATRKERTGLKIEKSVFQSEDSERLTAYKSLIREEFARKSSVFICLPTREEAIRIGEVFKKGISEYTYILHGGMPAKKIVEAWQSAVGEKHPVLIVATPLFLSIPRADINTIVMERESSGAYRTINRPEIDLRIFAEYFAEERGARLIFGDRALRTETLYRHYEHEFAQFIAVKARSLSLADGSVIDMKKYRPSGGKYFTTLSNELKALIELVMRDRGRLAVIVGRRGLAGTTVCSDCGATVLCEKCGAPLVLHERKSARLFICHKCGFERSVGENRPAEAAGEEKCRDCGSWRLTPLGVGAMRLADEISREYPSATIFRYDSDTITTEKLAHKTMNDFESAHGAVLIGTEMAISHLGRVTGSAIAGIDALFTVPEFRMNEKIFSLILALREKTEKTILIQTQQPEQDLFSFALRGDLLSFYREESAERKRLNYPPYTVLVKISWEAKKENVDREIDDMSVKFPGYDVRNYISPFRGVRGGIPARILIKIPRETWVDEKLLAVLKDLPSKYTVAINPESVM